VIPMAKNAHRGPGASGGTNPHGAENAAWRETSTAGDRAVDPARSVRAADDEGPTARITARLQPGTPASPIQRPETRPGIGEFTMLSKNEATDPFVRDAGESWSRGTGERAIQNIRTGTSVC